MCINFDTHINIANSLQQFKGFLKAAAVLLRDFKRVAGPEILLHFPVSNIPPGAITYALDLLAINSSPYPAPT